MSVDDHPTPDPSGSRRVGGEPSRSAPRSGTGSATGPGRNATASYVLAGVLLAAPFIALLWVSSYAKAEPRLFGFPFFYWYQLLWVFIAAAMTYAALRIVQHAAPHRERLTDRSGARTDDGSAR